MTFSCSELAPFRYALDAFIQLEEFTTDRSLKQRIPETRFLHVCRKVVFPKQVKPGQIIHSPFAVNEVLTEYRTMTDCRETASRRLRPVIVTASASLANGALDHENPALQDGVSSKGGRH